MFKVLDRKTLTLTVTRSQVEAIDIALDTLHDQGERISRQEVWEVVTALHYDIPVTIRTLTIVEAVDRRDV